ncbi:MAG: TetR/AcrR family transcriptional regulator [Butyrivibrio sp.]|uniref:TetR/AcrR family transcriptional regulator n=1 Tax=Butyrivibrio sp. NC2002 TaxID=1410610 RepID=UPI00056B3858|nr:TetR/AcrR family transcriptional regulator [Butyrivibrio sp. NC2002]MBE5860547.1 TetR/AcrR family transcriptional regulator [Butyrivibrio sp.]
MSRKATITQEEIINAAFKITRKEGFDQITSRRLAGAAGCSTQPIFRIYENMDELKKDVFDRAVSYFEDYCRHSKKTHETPFVDLGLSYIAFAQSNANLFKLLFISADSKDSKSMYDIVNGSDENIVKEVARAKEQGVQNAEQLFMKMWIFIHGAGCMAVTGDYDLEEADSIAMLTSAYEAFRQA